MQAGIGYSEMFIRVITRAANTRIGFSLIRLLLKPKGIFLCYPVEARFADHFASRRRQQKSTWDPYLIGLMRQGTASSLVFAISATEEDIRNRASFEQLRDLVHKTENLRRYFGSHRVAMAGILPSVLRARRLRSTGIEVEVTCIAVANAVLSLLSSLETMPLTVVVLGGKGYIGRSLVQELRGRQLGLPLVSVDKGDELFNYRNGLFINCTIPGFIEQNYSLFPSGSVLLNEVYPAPSPDAVSSLEANGVMVFHVAGLAGKVFPHMPGEYKDAVPCCAAFPGNEGNVIVKRVKNDTI